MENNVEIFSARLNWNWPRLDCLQLPSRPLRDFKAHPTTSGLDKNNYYYLNLNVFSEGQESQGTLDVYVDRYSIPPSSYPDTGLRASWISFPQDDILWDWTENQFTDSYWGTDACMFTPQSCQLNSTRSPSTDPPSHSWAAGSRAALCSCNLALLCGRLPVMHLHMF